MLIDTANNTNIPTYYAIMPDKLVQYGNTEIYVPINKEKALQKVIDKINNAKFTDEQLKRITDTCILNMNIWGD